MSLTDSRLLSHPDKLLSVHVAEVREAAQVILRRYTPDPERERLISEIVNLHDLGKNMVGAMLRTSGFDVMDLGKDVNADRIVEDPIDSAQERAPERRQAVIEDFVERSALVHATD